VGERAELQDLVASLRAAEDRLLLMENRELILSRALEEARKAQEAIGSLPDSGSLELLVPIGGGVLLPVVYMGGANPLLSVGADVFIEGGKAKALNFLAQRDRELEQLLQQVRAEKAQVAETIDRLRQEIAKLLQAQRGHAGGA
jgi:prefoldin alpha subunit